MCASYGLGGGTRTEEETDEYGIEPLDTRESRVVIHQWLQEWNGRASTTREQKSGINRNPVILSGEDGRTVELGWWWLHVGGRPATYTAFNSRDDALVQKWKAPFQQRALVPASWYSEGGKRWALPSGEVFAIAAITAPRVEPDGSVSVSYSMVTRQGIGEAATVVSARGESRMPLILPISLHDEWLSLERRGDAALVERALEASEELSLAMTTGEATLF